MPWPQISLILLWLAWQLAFPIDLIRSDLGRHIKNGELLLSGHWEILYQNYYSYTYPHSPFINYHWFFGVVCYLLQHYLGFTGLSVVFLSLRLFTFYLFFCCWQRYVSFTIACAVAFLSIPFLCFRTEIRPEILSYFFCGIFWCVLDAYQQKRLSSSQVFPILCILQIIWVNTHVFFFLGPLLVLLFGFQRNLFFLLLAVCLINPFGFHIFDVPWESWAHKSSYQITESLSVLQALKSNLLAVYRPFLIYFLTVVTALILALIFLIRRDGYRKYVAVGLLLLILSLAAFKAVRMIELFGYGMIPVMIFVYGSLVTTRKKMMEIALLLLGIFISLTVHVNWDTNRGFGLKAHASDAADFLKQAKIEGPIFNNYSIGGYLIYSLSPAQQFFVDDRGVAAFPEDFFAKTFIPLQASDDVWHELDDKYHFNAIVYASDRPDWDNGFLWRRLNDPTWALVFNNNESVIFLKCNAQNQRSFAQPLCRQP